MFSRPSIISDRVGAAEFLDDDACFVFESGDAAALAARISEAHARRDDLPRMGAAARRDFERNMTFDRFARDLRVGGGRGNRGSAPRAKRTGVDRADAPTALPRRSPRRTAPAAAVGRRCASDGSASPSARRARPASRPARRGPDTCRARPQPFTPGPAALAASGARRGAVDRGLALLRAAPAPSRWRLCALRACLAAWLGSASAPACSTSSIPLRDARRPHPAHGARRGRRSRCPRRRRHGAVQPGRHDHRDGPPANRNLSRARLRRGAGVEQPGLPRSRLAVGAARSPPWWCTGATGASISAPGRTSCRSRWSAGRRPRNCCWSTTACWGRSARSRPWSGRCAQAGPGVFGLLESLQGGPHLQSWFTLARGPAAVADLARFLAHFGSAGRSGTSSSAANCAWHGRCARRGTGWRPGTAMANCSAPPWKTRWSVPTSSAACRPGWRQPSPRATGDPDRPPAEPGAPPVARAVRPRRLPLHQDRAGPAQSRPAARCRDMARPGAPATSPCPVPMLRAHLAALGP